MCFNPSFSSKDTEQMYWYDQFLYDESEHQVIVASSKSTEEWQYARFNADTFQREESFTITAGDTDFS